MSESDALAVAVEFYDFASYEDAKGVFDRLEKALRQGSTWVVKVGDEFMLAVVYEPEDEEVVGSFDFSPGTPRQNPDPALAFAMLKRRYKVIGETPDQLEHYEHGKVMTPDGELEDIDARQH